MRLIEWPPARPMPFGPAAYPAIALLTLAFLVVYFDVDRELFLAINGAGRSAPDWLWASLTLLGDALVAATLLVPVARRHPQVVWAVLLAALLATAYTRGLKPLFDVSRPPAVLAVGDINVIGPAWKSSSFPSGHSATIATLGGVLALHTGSLTIRALLCGLVIVVGTTRVLVGVHWPLDVIFGWLGGWLAALAGTYLYARRPFWRGRRARQVQLVGLFACAVALLVHDGGYSQGAWVSWSIGVSAACLAAASLWGLARGSAKL